MKTKNILNETEKGIKPFLRKLKKQDYVVGIVLLGGLGKRQFHDEFSDIDITLFTLKKDTFRFPFPFEFYYKVEGKLVEFNIHQQILEDEEEKTEWDDSKKEAYSRGKIIYDPTGRVRKLIKEKTKFDRQKAFNRLVWIIQQYKWRGQIHFIRSYKRGYPESSHNLLNQCSEILLEAIYLLNGRYLPHKKWVLVYLDQMKSPWNQLKEDFKHAIIVRNYTLSDIKRRIRILDNIYKTILNETLKQYKNFPNDPYSYYYRNFVQINRETKIDRLISKLSKKIKRGDIVELKGILCFNLIDTKSELYKEMSFNRGIERYKNVIRRSIKHGRKTKD